MDNIKPSQRFHLQELSLEDSMSTLMQDVREGLFVSPRSLPPKYFYDDEGSKLFDAICKTQDYYPTRTEAQLLQKHVDQILNIVKPNSCIELGAGTSEKTEILLSQIMSGLHSSKFTYLSIDVCVEILMESAFRLLKKYNALHIESIAGEYIPAIQAAPSFDNPALYIFIGSSIGNFSEQESIKLLSEVSKKMNKEDYFLIGMDRVKDKDILERAYDDSEGVTAKFNLNVLNVLNYKLGANFDLRKFKHHASYNEELQQIEMYLESLHEQKVYFSKIDQELSLMKGEKILTEVSKKYSASSMQHIFNESGLKEAEHFQPDNKYFSLVLAQRM